MIYIMVFLAGVATGVVALFLIAWGGLVMISRGDH